MKDARREIHVALALLCLITFHVVPHAQQTAQPSVPSPTPSSTVPRSVPFNGQLTAPTGNARTGSVLLTFALYSDQQGGTPLWTEQQLVTLEADGRYSVILGRLSTDGLPGDAFAAGTPRWLGVQVEGEAEQPRVMLLSVPYALKAGDADTVGGKPASEFVLNTKLFETVTSTLKQEGYAPRGLSAPTSTTNVVAKFTDGSGTIGDSNMVSAAGNVGVNVAPSYPLHVFGAATYQTLRLDSAHAVGSSFTLGPAGFAGEHTYSLLATGPAASTGAGFLTVYDEIAGQYRLVINPNGNVGIGTTSPQHRLRVSGGPAWTGSFWTGSLELENGSAIGWHSNVAGNRFGIGQSNGGLFFFRSSSDPGTTGSAADYVLTMSDGGNVGIGTTTPLSRLTVRGPNTSTSTVALRVENSIGQFALQVYDDRTVQLGALFGSSATHACLSGLSFAACLSAAEYVPTAPVNPHGPPEAGDLVSIAPAAANPYGDEHAPFVVVKAATACDANLLGFLLDPASGADGKKVNEHYLPLAIYGYFPAKVTIENGAVKRGDPITSSSKPGVGMKSTGACRIIGYALEDADQDGTIQVFAHLSESAASVAAPLQSEVAALRRDNAELQTRLDRLEHAFAAMQASGTGAGPTTAERR